jgi:hypothetical protein
MTFSRKLRKAGFHVASNQHDGLLIRARRTDWEEIRDTFVRAKREAGETIAELALKPLCEEEEWEDLMGGEDGIHLTSSDIERFRSKVDTSSECHLWTAAVDRDGYPRFKLNGSHVGAHRVAHYLATGKEPPVVMHAVCDRPSCCRPSHLQGGTQAQNIADRQAKDRQAKGSGAGRAKLSDEEVQELRAKYAEEDTSYRKLGEQYGLDHTSVGAIVRRESYAGVDSQERRT